MRLAVILGVACKSEESTGGGGGGGRTGTGLFERLFSRRGESAGSDDDLSCFTRAAGGENNLVLLDACVVSLDACVVRQG